MPEENEGELQKRIDKLEDENDWYFQYICDDFRKIVAEAKKELLKYAVSLELIAKKEKLPSGFAIHEKLIAIPESDWKKWFGDSS